jgi:hypothetical protein
LKNDVPVDEDEVRCTLGRFFPTLNAVVFAVVSIPLSPTFLQGVEKRNIFSTAVDPEDVVEGVA